MKRRRLPTALAVLVVVAAACSTTTSDADAGVGPCRQFLRALSILLRALAIRLPRLNVLLRGEPVAWPPDGERTAFLNLTARHAVQPLLAPQLHRTATGSSTRRLAWARRTCTPSLRRRRA